ncbi:glutathione S-transferase [Methylomonas sp. LW13]|uniref:glutathione S-transferase n=1 Tax=unclassified Methylomonas TaxID=2608980 RepID=UPI0009FBB119|nr:glutathione S-transferase [Methylomonas sp. LW13]QBC28508.1 glutathione S-transferase [Methylomonas sp. LW13]
MNTPPATTEQIYPILYSFRRCPYAMRARLAIAVSGVSVALREIELSNKPEAMLAISPKGTVPLLLLPDGRVIEQSLDIMLWALAQHDPQNWLNQAPEDTQRLIDWNDGDFKYYLDRYKYADRYPEQTPADYRQQGEVFLAELETRLQRHKFLCGDNFSLADAATLPFIRQFAAVDNAWFENSPYPALQQWLNTFLRSNLFAAVMQKYPPWNVDDPLVLFRYETGLVPFQ